MWTPKSNSPQKQTVRWRAWYCIAVRSTRQRRVGELRRFDAPWSSGGLIMIRICRRLFLTICLFLISSAILAAEGLPAQLSDKEFWKIVTDFSEPNGVYIFENFVSNEDDYQVVLPELKKTFNPGSIFVGVGPEQNLTYISALKPKVAFIVDIRRQNLLEHLLYKAVFELSADRVEFLSRL